MITVAEALALKTWAVVGATDNPAKFGCKIYKFLKEAGYQVYAVNPGLTEILGDTCYPSLADLPVKPDGVDVVVPPRVALQVVSQCAELGISTVWLQPGANADEVVEAAQKLNLDVIHDSCIMAEIRNQSR